MFLWTEADEIKESLTLAVKKYYGKRTLNTIKSINFISGHNFPIWNKH